MERRDALKALLALPVVQTVEVARLKPEDVIVLSEGLTLKVVRQ